MDTKQAHHPESIGSTSEAYKGASPKWAAFSSGMTYVAFAAPFMWLANGVTNLGFDRIFNKVPFKQDAWKRFKSIEAVPAAVVGGFVAWDVYKKGKLAFAEAKDAEHQFNKLSMEHDLYREQLTEAGIKPNDVTFVREVDTRTLKLEGKPAASHADKIAAEKAVSSEAAPSI